jgi:CDP-glucose 4,6-dehydratase
MRQFWQGKTVLVTGHTGFKGSWLTIWLQKMGATLIGFSRSIPTEPSLFNSTSIGKRIVNIEGDIRNLRNVRQVIDEYRPEIIFHLAAQSLVRKSYLDPIETFSTNIMGTVNLLEAVRLSTNTRVVVNITSDKCYENYEWLWGYRENERMGGHDPYSCSKGCAELITSAFRKSFFYGDSNNSLSQVALATARAGNVIGGGDWAQDRLIPDFIRAITEKREIIMRNPMAIRPWQHVLEPLRGYLLLAERLYEHGENYAEGWNFGPADSDAKSVQWIVERLTERWGVQKNWKIDSCKKNHEAHYLKLDSSKAKTMLNWMPRWNLETALIKTTDWYKAFYNNVDPYEVTLRQINEYECDLTEKGY